MKALYIIAGGLLCFVAVQSFVIDPSGMDEDNGGMLPKLSDYHIFQGDPSALVPTDAFKPYEPSTTLFSDYAEKQRLIMVPAGSSMKITGNGLPEFPDGAILAKTFYYYNDKRDPSKGRRIIETRILVRTGSTWHAGTYVWNDAQTEALLATKGSKHDVKWLDENGAGRSIDYRVPSNKDCATCHNSNNVLTPIGPTAMNLNIEVTRNNARINQLKYFQSNSLIGAGDLSGVATLPDWQNPSYTLEQRARAYLAVNCAHCHNPNGFCAAANFNAGYETPFASTNISDKKKLIVQYMKQGRMPLLGTTVVHKEGLALVQEYINSLH